MEGAIDLRLVLTVAGMLASVAGAMAVARQSIKQLTALIADIETRLRKLDSHHDRLETEIKTNGQRLGILAQMSSPEALERRHRETGGLLAKIAYIEKNVSALQSMHNGKHPPTANVRTAE
tara:strand:- start:407 stop:769 length:363 start_codon:yes stop_codon:yes gene_type:complete